ncbi:MAG: hypothetical protein KDD02_03305 [Phaeodactylibacter sp.]|nr:hypothetical protein [Phaeodactylibacter sp.]
MKGKKLLILLNSMNEEEFLNLSKAVHSPLINTNERISQLYDYLKDHFPDFNKALSNQEELYHFIFPGEPYNDYKLRRLLSGFTQQVGTFLALLEVIRDKELEKKLVRRVLSVRNLHSLYEKEAKAGISALESSPYRDAAYFQEKVQLYDSYYYHPQTEKHTVKPSFLQDLSDSLDAWYILFKYRLAVELKNREQIFSEKYQLESMDFLEGAVAKKVLGDNTVYQAYQTLSQLYQHQGSAHFQSLKEALLKVIGHIRKNDQLILFQQLLNFAIRQINLGQSGFYTEVLGLYKLGLNYGLLTDSGRMSEATYTNIVLVGCEEGEFDWTYEFINDWAASVDVEASAREDVKAHCFSLWHYFRKEYDEALDLIREHRFSEPFILRARMLEVRITFEQFLLDTTYYNLLTSKAKAFEKYLSRARHLPKLLKESHNNTLSLLRKIASAHHKKDSPLSIAEWVQQEGNSNRPLVLRNWLLKQVSKITP